MPKQLDQDIKIIQFIPIQTITETTNGAAKDMKVSEDFSFETVLANIEIGNLGDQTSTKVKIVESDASDLSGATVAEGGEEITVAADTSYKAEIQRTKRYLGSEVTIAGGSSPSAEIFVGGILWNTAKPFPII